MYVTQDWVHCHWKWQFSTYCKFCESDKTPHCQTMQWCGCSDCHISCQVIIYFLEIWMIRCCNLFPLIASFVNRINASLPNNAMMWLQWLSHLMPGDHLLSGNLNDKVLQPLSTYCKFCESDKRLIAKQCNDVAAVIVTSHARWSFTFWKFEW